MLRKVIVVGMICLSLAFVAGCQKDTPVEKAGKKINKLADSIKDKF